MGLRRAIGGRRPAAPVGHHPALGPAPAASALAAVEGAAARAIAVSFDGNWRGKLWERWGSDPRAILTRLVAHADLTFGNHRDIAPVLGRDFPGEADDRRREAAEAAFAAFPALRTIASTTRHVEHVDLYRLSARIDARDGDAQTAEVMLAAMSTGSAAAMPSPQACSTRCARAATASRLREPGSRLPR